MLTVPEAARRVGRNPETVRRWIREGKLRSTRIGTQHLIDEEELRHASSSDGRTLPIPAEWARTHTGEPMPDWVAVIHRSRAEH